MKEAHVTPEGGEPFSTGEILFLTSLVITIAGFLFCASAIVMMGALAYVYGPTVAIQYAIGSVGVVVIGVLLYVTSTRVD